MVTFRQIRIFTEVVRHGSFRACASRTGLSQAVVSNHVRELENNLGVTLFERRPGQATVLTQQGQHAFERLSVILSDLTDLQRELAGRTAKRLITFSTFSYILLRFQENIERFQQSHPHVDIRFQLDPPDNQTLALQVRRGDIDLAGYFAFEDDDAKEGRRVGHTRLAVYVGRGHPLAGRIAVSGAQLGEYPAIVLGKNNSQRAMCDEALARIGAKADHILMETDALPLLLNNVRRGLAWICLFEDSIAEDDETLVKLDMASEIPRIEIRVLTRRSARYDPNLSDLIKYISEG